MGVTAEATTAEVAGKVEECVARGDFAGVQSLRQEHTDHLVDQAINALVRAGKVTGEQLRSLRPYPADGPPPWSDPRSQPPAAAAPPPGDRDAPADAVAPATNGQHPTKDVEPFKLWSLEDLATLPPPTWRIVGALPDESFTLLFGPTGTLKSFVAVDMALSVAAGVPWQGHKTKPGSVIYIAAEGGAGINKRAAAWLLTHKGADLGDRFRVIPHRVSLADADSLRRLRAAVETYAAMLDEPPALIVVDTWSRNTPGVDENNSRDQSKLIDDLFDDMAKQHGCGVVVVHHSGVESGRERGSTALPGAADCRWETKRGKKDPNLTMVCHKLKEWEEAPDLELKAHVVDLPEEFVTEDDPHPTSLVLLRKDPVVVDPHVEHRQVAARLQGHGVLSQTKVQNLLKGFGQNPARSEAAKAAARCPECPVESWTHGQSIRYAHRDEAAL